MVILKIGETDVSAYVTDYKITNSPESSSQNDGFENWDGTFYSFDGSGTLPFKTVISAKLENVPSSVGMAVSSSFFSDSSDSKTNAAITYSSPGETKGNFKCTSYSAEVDENDYSVNSDSVSSWTINLTLESTAASDSTESGSL